MTFLFVSCEVLKDLFPGKHDLLLQELQMPQ